MFTRTLQSELIDSSQHYPVTTVLGPRQSGKSTLVRMTFPDKPYANMENPDDRRLALTDPRGFLSQYANGAIVDEVQQTPELLSYIQTMVDEKQENGMFILTGSHQPLLHQAISQSLAGRTALLTLLPLSMEEMKPMNLDFSVDDYLLSGGYPRIYAHHVEPTKAYRDYFQTYVQRDVRQLVNVKDLSLFEKFMRLCAGRVGNLFEATALANEVGVSGHTIQHWLSVLEASFIIFRLQPYFENFSKRMIKSPKLYFTDVGLASYLLNIENVTQLNRDPLRGALFENLVILELMKYRLNRGKNPNLYFYRDHHQNEIDVIIASGHHLIPVEIKSAQTFRVDFLKQLHFFQQLVKERMPTGFVIYAGRQEQALQKNHLIHYANTANIWQALDRASKTNTESPPPHH